MSRFASILSLTSIALFTACGDDGGGNETPDAGVTPDAIVGGAQAPFPSLVCPGSDGCTGTGDGTFRVGAAKLDITPDLSSYDSGWEDVDEDNVYDKGEPYVDDNDSGKFDAVWIAGSQNARPATGVHDPIWARAMVFEKNDVRIGLVVYDFIGWFVNEMDATRALIGDELELDHVIFASTHSHQSPDTLGLWGLTGLESGVDPDYNQWVHAKTVEVLEAAIATLEPVAMTVGSTMTVDESGSAKPYVADVRDPIILDPTMTILRFTSIANPDTTVGTLVNWSAHPEYVWFDNNLLSSDIVHYIRETIENGAPETAAGAAAEGLGGVTVYVQGPIGGQVGPITTRPIDADGNEVTEGGFPRAEAAGTNVGRLALQTITSADDAEAVDDPDLSLRTGELLLRVENIFYHVGGLVGVFNRQFIGWDQEKPIADDNMPYIPSRVTYLEIGPVGIITTPGELHPELFVGGYDGSWSFGVDIYSDDNPNPPRLDEAPGGPYLRDLLLMNEGITYPLVFGLAEDNVGYIVPEWNFELAEGSPYIEEAEGDHYEETNSVGPTGEAEIVGPMRALITWRP